MNRDEFQALTPWSFFLPVALAVMLGVLLANALAAALFDDDDAARTMEAEAAAVATPAAGTPAEGRKAAVTMASTPPASRRELAVLAPERLPGPSSARRDGETRACIGGTIAVRADNGWEQQVVDDAPARCTASSR